MRLHPDAPVTAYIPDIHRGAILAELADEFKCSAGNALNELLTRHFVCLKFEKEAS